MASKLVHLRRQAFFRQNGCCFYCGLPIVHHPQLPAFAAQHGLSEASAKALLCTAEHLEARCDGGKESIANIAAACLACNQRRHQFKPAPPPEKYREIVQKQMEHGGWHKAALRRLASVGQAGSMRPS